MLNGLRACPAPVSSSATAPILPDAARRYAPYDGGPYPLRPDPAALVGASRTMSAYGDRYACGLIRENGRTLIVSAGLGTSFAPLRLGAVPDMWLIRLGPVPR